MCDTIVALGPATADGSTLFGKNSDREPDEAQNLVVIPATSHPSGAEARCTHVSVPQVPETFAVILCNPFWMFGAEMGANEHGVMIGNEALFTRERVSPTGLTGMDLLRLALERSATAREALDIIIALLEKHGQGGRHGYRQNLKYMNGFLIADSRVAYVLETVKKWWAWKRIEDFWSISNIISLEQDFDECSEGLIENATKKGWCKTESDFNFRRCYSDIIYTRGSAGKSRECRSRSLLESSRGKLTVQKFMELLRDHGPDPDWTPDRQKQSTLCMHATGRLLRPTQSACSLVARAGADGNFFYSTGASNPCMSPFFPASPLEALPRGYVASGGSFKEGAWWWDAERLHRKALWRFREALGSIGPRIREYERDMVSELEAKKAPPGAREIDSYFERARDIMTGWGRELDKMSRKRTRPLFRMFWNGYNKRNGLKGL